jgi:hypothetical protein
VCLAELVSHRSQYKYHNPKVIIWPPPL